MDTVIGNGVINENQKDNAFTIFHALGKFLYNKSKCIFRKILNEIIC